MTTFEQRKGLYGKLWEGVQILEDRRPAMEAAATKVAAGRRHYEAISAAVGVPWWFIGFLHLRESNCNFARHLHNGDPLTGKTRLVPANRPPWKPRNGKVYTFEESAEDALKMKGLHLITDWSIERICYEAERFNGMGYAYKGLPSPYLWGGTNRQKPGKYIADGKFSSTHWDIQPGVCAVLKILLEREPTLLSTDPVEVEAIAAPKADYKPETHPEAHALLKGESQSYGLMASLLKALGLPATLVGGAATASSETGLQAYAPFISFFKEYGFKLAMGVVALIVIAEVVQYVRRTGKQA
jgi:lysozyme family protein